jgi:hypothetical protein
VSHTPGPWEFDYEAGEVSAPNGTVVLYPTMLPDEAEEVANGHLVAAAPDLLEALERVKTKFDEMTGNKSSFFSVADYKAVVSALKKAKGQ